MADILYTRLLLWKKRPFSMLFWLLIPIACTVIIVQVTNTVQEDSRVPVGLVLEEDTKLVNDLKSKIAASSLIHAYELSEDEALYKLEKHELDSVFIIHDGYEDAILKGRRNRILSSYQTELSFAYSPVKEMIVSLVQEETARSKAVHFIQKMEEHYLGQESWTFAEISEKSKEIQEDENLLSTTFQFSDSNHPVDNTTLVSWNTWGLWAIFSFLSTLFLSDWIIHEKQMTVSTRYAFMKMPKFSYYVRIIGLYMLLFFLFDLLALAVFTLFLQESVSFSYLFILVSYRFMITSLTFGIAQCFRSKGAFYAVSVLMTLLIAIISGTIIPVNGVIPDNHFLEMINPLHAFLSNQLTIAWSILALLLVLLVLIRKERSHA